MRSLWARWPGALDPWKPGSRDLLLLLDFDGTLSPLAATPGAARMGTGLRRSLVRLAGRPGVHVGVISGRALADVEKRVGVPGLFYGGNHGMEIKGPGVHFRHPKAFSLRPVLEEVGLLCRAVFRDVPGSFVEQKGLGVAVHDRRVAKARMNVFRRRLKKVKDGVRGLPVLWRPGRRVWEALPGVDWDKGRAAVFLWEHLKRPFPVALGDDKTDEFLFRAVNRAGGLSVRVAPAGPTAARCALPRQSDVTALLRKLDDHVEGSIKEAREAA